MLNNPLLGPKILVTGGSGLLGKFFLTTDELQNYQVLTPTHSELDISQQHSVNRFFSTHQPNIIVNFAAHRNATTAESQRNDRQGSVWRTNVLGSKYLADQAQKTNAYVIHISSDYIFAGTSEKPGPYAEIDQPETNDDLLSWYGVTKKKAEEEILTKVGNTAAIIRINNITRPNNTEELDYIGKILKLYKQQQLYSLFEDQHLTLTHIPDLNKSLLKLITAPQAGIFHIASTNRCNPYELANYTIQKLFRQVPEIKKSSLREYLILHPRRYPQFGGLKTELTQKKLGITFQTWQSTVDSFVTYEK